jgi:hypothetical protein
MAGHSPLGWNKSIKKVKQINSVQKFFQNYQKKSQLLLNLVIKTLQ